MTDTDPGERDDVRRNTPGGGVSPEPRQIEPDSPEEFGLVQLFWGDGKGKTTAAMGMGFRAAGHGFRVHMLQFMKGGADSVEDVRGEYNAIAAMPGFSYENTGHYGWHGMADGSAEADHASDAQAGLERARELIAAAAAANPPTPTSTGPTDPTDPTDPPNPTGPLDLDAPPEDGLHMLILDELLYAADRELVAPEAVEDLIDSKPDDLELVITGSHTEPDYLYESADLVTRIGKEKHPIDAGQRARRGTEY